MKLSLLFEHLRTQFKAFCVPSQNVSVDEMMKAFTGQSAYTVKMLNKLVSEGYKMWALADHGYVWHFLWHSCVEGMLKSTVYNSICVLIVI
jgi:Transposase IS4